MKSNLVCYKAACFDSIIHCCHSQWLEPPPRCFHLCCDIVIAQLLLQPDSVPFSMSPMFRSAAVHPLFCVFPW